MMRPSSAPLCPTSQIESIVEAVGGLNLHGAMPFPLTIALLDLERVVDSITPLALYHRLRQGEDRSFLLESLEGGERWARYSFLGAGSLAEITGRFDGVSLTTSEGDFSLPVSPEQDPSQILSSFLDQVCLPSEDQKLDGRFPGGAVGYFSYDTARCFEPTLQSSYRDGGRPLFRFLIPRFLVRFDGLRQRISITACVNIQRALVEKQKGADSWENTLRQELQAALADIEALENRLKHPVEPLSTLEPVAPAPRLKRDERGLVLPDGVETSLDRETFMKQVERCKEYIRAGDIIQIVLSQRLSFDAKTVLGESGDILPLYRRLRLLNPSPYLFVLELGDEHFLGSSPEVMVRKSGSRVEVRPIAGTRKRGHSEEEDLSLAEDLLADAKERAEHIMLLDLGRNDLGRVSEIGSVKVPEQMVIERYSHVMHLVSHVTSTLREEAGWREAFGATFPAGTLSGAPKVRAMQIIDELEPVGREVYGGAVGYIGFDGDMDFCIAIRTLHIRDGRIFVQAGAGIVADSDPEKEWQETLNKAAALMASMSYIQ